MYMFVLGGALDKLSVLSDGSLWTSCETPLTLKKFILAYSMCDLKLEYNPHDKNLLIIDIWILGPKNDF